MRKVDVVLVKPGSQKQLYGDLSHFKLSAIEPPFWGALLAAYLRHLGYSVALLDAEVENWSYGETAQKIKEIDPLLATIMVSGTNPSASTMNMTGAGLILDSLKKLDPTLSTLLAGLHPSALPERTLSEEVVDFVCQGEGFYTLPPLIDALKSKDRPQKIPGLWYKDGPLVVAGVRPPLIEDLDSLPRPAWDLLPMKAYRAHNWHCFNSTADRQPYAVLYSSLGCPFHCTFCCINALFGKNTIRYRGTEKVLEEIDYLVSSWGIKNIKIMDEMFALSEKRVLELCNRIRERGYDLNMWAYARVDTVTEKMLQEMKAAGINWVAYGFESGSSKVISDVRKGYSLDRIEKVVQTTCDSGLHICANYIFGLPEDDYASMNETLKLMLDINAEWANIYCAMAYPGSRLYEMAVNHGWALPDTWEHYSQYAYETLPLPTKHLTGGQVLAFRDYAFNVYYSNPSYLHMINEKFGPETVEHIQAMTLKKLGRKYASI